VSGYDLYMEVDDEDEGLFVIGMIETDPFQGDLQAESAYWCVFDAVCYTIWSGFKYDNKGNKIPQPIESLSDEMIDHRFMEEIRKVDGYQEKWADRLKQYLMENHPAGSDKKIQREELLNLIA
jgi:phosphoenolpyruvate carboxylase